jgi:predicted nucleotidyltransferase component of viral defense system
LSRERQESFNFVLTQYANERFIYRLSRSRFKDQFVLKGATLFVVWTGHFHRPTRDLDLLGYGDSTPGTVADLVRTVCQEDVEPDGLIFDRESVRTSEMREEQEYEGVRVHLTANLEAAKINLQIDVAFGDVIHPSAQRVSYPALLDFPAPKVRAYPQESVVAEKLEALVSLGMANSRMKDFYDLLVLAERFAFEGRTLTEAIHATFERRQTTIPEEPTGLTESFYGNTEKVKQWTAFLTRSQLGADAESLQETIDHLRKFLLPPLKAIASGSKFEVSWSPGGPWQ